MARRKRGNGEGSVHKLKDRDLWRATVTVRRPDGTKYRPSQYGKTKAEALAELRKLVAVGSDAPKPAGKSTAGMLVRRYLERPPRTLAPTTADLYKQVAETHILPRIGSVLAAKVNRETVRGVLADMADAGLSGSKQAHALTVLRQAFALAVAEGILSENPAAAVNAPKRNPKEIRPLSPDEARRFLAVAAGHQHAALFWVAVASGLRQGELIGLRWEDVDLDRGTIAVRRKLSYVRCTFHEGGPKTRSGRRSVSLPPVAVEALRRQRERLLRVGLAACPLVFPNRTGGPLRRPNVHRMLGLLLDRAGVGRIRFHDLRHTAATLLLAAGEHPKVVQEMLGHARVALTLDVYSHVLPGMQERAAARMESILTTEPKEAAHDSSEARGSDRIGSDHQRGGGEGTGRRNRRAQAAG